MNVIPAGIWRNIAALLRLHIDLNPDVRRCDAVIWLQHGASAGRREEDRESSPQTGGNVIAPEAHDERIEAQDSADFNQTD